MAGRECAAAAPMRAPRGVHWRARLAALARAIQVLRVPRAPRVLKVLERVVGVPDYDGYLAHHARFHPETPPLSRDDFVQHRQEDRYSRPGSRCC